MSEQSTNELPRDTATAATTTALKQFIDFIRYISQKGNSLK
jgi:hypothetical protein